MNRSDGPFRQTTTTTTRAITVATRRNIPRAGEEPLVSGLKVSLCDPRTVCPPIVIRAGQSRSSHRRAGPV